MYDLSMKSNHFEDEWYWNLGQGLEQVMKNFVYLGQHIESKPCRSTPPSQKEFRLQCLQPLERICLNFHMAIIFLLTILRFKTQILGKFSYFAESGISLIRWVREDS
jgi:hypothetical protein